MCYNEFCPQPEAKTFLCSRCKNARYCSKSCQLACLSYHKRVCIDPKKTAFNLMETVYADDFSVMSKELEVSYGFENCKTMEDKIYLLGLYQGLIKVLECDLRDLDKAFCENKLPEFIVSEFYDKTRPENCGGYFRWFIKDLNRCRH